MSIEETPKVRYYESDSNPLLNGDGAQIPIFIGLSGNETPAEGIQKFKNFSSCYKTVANGGLGTDLKTNPLLAAINDFFKESKKTNSDDISVPYIYVIDLGAAGVSTAKAWTDAMTLAKAKRDVQVEVYVGFEQQAATSEAEGTAAADYVASMIGIMTSAVESIKTDAQAGNPRIAYFTVNGATDEQLMEYTDDSKPSYIQSTRVGLIEPSDFGKTVANICCTPYYEEPGYSEFRSISNGVYNHRSQELMNEMQAAGIIFIADELAGSEIHTRINLAVSTAFATIADNRKNDALLHARRNVDQLIRDVYAILFEQLKRNETETNLSFLQTDVDAVVDDKRKDGHMMEGTELQVRESESNPYDLIVDGVAVPVNSTLLIGFSLYIESPNAVAIGGK